jgi:hypothetical protein
MIFVMKCNCRIRRQHSNYIYTTNNESDKIYVMRRWRLMGSADVEVITFIVK